MPADGHLHTFVLAFDAKLAMPVVFYFYRMADNDPFEGRFVGTVTANIDLYLFTGDEKLLVTDLKILLRSIPVTEYDLCRRHPVDLL